MSLPEFSVRRPITVSVVALAVVLFGVIAAGRLPVDMMPDIEVPVISVITRYPGASATDVEEKVTKVLEEAVADVPDIKKISSISKEHVSVLSLTFAHGANLDRAANRIRDNIEFAKQRFPPDAENPMLFHFDTTRFPTVVMAIVSSGGNPFVNRKIIEDRILDPLRRIPGVGAVYVLNGPERQIIVEVDRARMRAYGLTLDQIARTLAAENVVLPAGNLEIARRQLAVRATAEYESLAEIGAIILGRSAAGGLIRLRDVATVKPGLEELDEEAAVETEPAVWCGVRKQSGANTVEVARLVRRQIEEIGKRLPPTLHLLVLTDGSRFILRTLSNLETTALVGGVLVVLVVWLFLRRLRASLIVALAIPTSGLVVFVLLYLGGYTLNTMSLLAVAVAMGMVVDNAIVVLDNVTRHRELGAEPGRAAARGATEVAPAIAASTLTTVVIFVPLMFVTGLVGALFGQLALVVTGTLVASLVVALTLIPAYCARLLSRPAAARRGGRGEEAGMTPWLAPTQRAYTRLLTAALRHRGLTIAVAVAVAAAAVAMVPLVGFDFLPRQDSSEIHFRAELPVGTSVAHSMEVGRELVRIAKKLPAVRTVAYNAGTSKVPWATALGGREGSNVIAGVVKLTPLGTRQRDVEIEAALRRQFLRVPGISSLSLTTGDVLSRLIGGLGRPLVVEVLGENYERMRAVATRLRGVVAGTPGTDDVTVDLFKMQPELRFILDRERASRLGVTAGAVAGALRTSMFGSVATRYRPEGEDIDVLLRLTPAGRSAVTDIGEVNVRAASGAVFKLRDLGRVVEAESPIEIRRKNKQRIVSIGAGVRGRALSDVARDVERAIARVPLPPDVIVELAGEALEQRQTFRDLSLLLLLGVLLVYLVLAGQYESLVDPLVIMFSVPFCFTGGLLALLVTRTTLSVPAFLGFILLVGVVVNNAIVFVDSVAQLRAEGHSLEEALLATGRRRLRPILMTAVTTVFGILPLALGRGEGAEFWGPLGRAVVGGLTLSTLVTLVLVPVVYGVFEPLRRGRRLPVPPLRPAGVAAGAVRLASPKEPARGGREAGAGGLDRGDATGSM